VADFVAYLCTFSPTLYRVSYEFGSEAGLRNGLAEGVGRKINYYAVVVVVVPVSVDPLTIDFVGYWVRVY
jgi:hypothetical protein